MAKRNSLATAIKSLFGRRDRDPVELAPAPDFSGTEPKMSPDPQKASKVPPPNALDQVDCQVLWEGVCSIPAISRHIPLVRDGKAGVDAEGRVHTLKTDCALCAGMLLHELAHTHPHAASPGTPVVPTDMSSRQWYDERIKENTGSDGLIDPLYEMALNCVLDLVDETEMENYLLPDSYRYYQVTNREMFDLLIKNGQVSTDSNGKLVLNVADHQTAALLWYFYHRKDILSQDGERLVKNSVPPLMAIVQAYNAAKFKSPVIEPQGSRSPVVWRNIQANVGMLYEFLKSLPFPKPPRQPPGGGGSADGDDGDAESSGMGNDAASQLRAGAAHDKSGGAEGKPYMGGAEAGTQHTTPNYRGGIHDNYEYYREVFRSYAYELLRASTPKLDKQKSYGATVRHPYRIITDGKCLVSPKLKTENIDTAVAVLLDRSGSMCGTIREVAAAAGAMGEAFSSMGASVAAWTYDTTEDEVPVTMLKHVIASGGTDMLKTLQASLTWLSNQSESRKILVFFTDGETCSRELCAQVIEQAHQEIGNLVVIGARLDGATEQSVYGLDRSALMFTVTRDGIEREFMDLTSTITQYHPIEDD